MAAILSRPVIHFHENISIAQGMKELVIPAQAGIQTNTECRIKSGMTGFVPLIAGLIISQAISSGYFFPGSDHFVVFFQFKKHSGLYFRRNNNNPNQEVIK